MNELIFCMLNPDKEDCWHRSHELRKVSEFLDAFNSGQESYMEEDISKLIPYYIFGRLITESDGNTETLIDLIKKELKKVLFGNWL